jgi:hypothetical protein
LWEIQQRKPPEEQVLLGKAILELVGNDVDFDDN